MPDYVPNTVVKVLRNVPLDSTYTDTRWFESEGEQVAFFTGKAKYTFTDMTYQRVNNSVAQPRGPLTCRVPRIADDLYDCNYIMFQNTNYGSKWFYAFIRQVNYISPSNTEIVYEIDYLQSFMFEFQIKPCFVEREHASAKEDEPFANLVPEPVEIPIWCEDIPNHYRLDPQDLGIAKDPYIIVGIAANSLVLDLLTPDGSLYSGVYSGVTYKAYPYQRFGDVNEFLRLVAVAKAEASIVDVHMSPVAPQKGTKANQYPVETGIDLKDTTFNTANAVYTVRNKKLLNGQFTYIKGTSDSGEDMVWLPELCRTEKFSGVCNVGFLPNFSMFFSPTYMGYTSPSTQTNEYGLSFEQSVSCTWNSYAYLGDFIKNAAKIALTVGAAYATAGGTIAASAGVSTAVRGASLDEMLGTSMTGKELVSSLAPKSAKDVDELSGVLDMFTGKGTTVKGSTAGDAMAFAMGLHGFEFRRMCPDAYTLERLDTFFDMFGYAVNTVKQPNLNTRASWNYVKLKNPCIFGSVPVQGMDAIKAAFARGIRLWHIDAVGDYSAQNPAK